MPQFMTGKNVKLQFKNAAGDWRFLCGVTQRNVQFTNGNKIVTVQKCDDPDVLIQEVIPTVDKVEINIDGGVSSRAEFQAFMALTRYGTDHMVELKLTYDGWMELTGEFFVPQTSIGSDVESEVTFSAQAMLRGPLTIVDL